MSIDSKEAAAAVNANLTAKKDAAIAVFINSVNTQIQTAHKLGRYTTTAFASKGVNVVFIYLYFISLGYKVDFPDYANQHGGFWPSLDNQPSDLFGYHWMEYWTNQARLFGVKAPTRVTLSWNSSSIPPTPPFPPLENFLILENGNLIELEDGSGAILLE